MWFLIKQIHWSAHPVTLPRFFLVIWILPAEPAGLVYILTVDAGTMKRSVYICIYIYIGKLVNKPVFIRYIMIYVYLIILKKLVYLISNMLNMDPSNEQTQN